MKWKWAIPFTHPSEDMIWQKGGRGCPWISDYDSFESWPLEHVNKLHMQSGQLDEQYLPLLIPRTKDSIQRARGCSPSRSDQAWSRSQTRLEWRGRRWRVMSGQFGWHVTCVELNQAEGVKGVCCTSETVATSSVHRARTEVHVHKNIPTQAAVPYLSVHV